MAFGHPTGTPKILIIPIKRGETDAAAPLSIGNHLAQELDEDGRVKPIVWSIGDPTFRDAVENGLIHVSKDFPSKSQGFAAAKALGVTYVLMYTSASGFKGTGARAELYADGREIWHNAQNPGTQTGGQYDPESSYTSVAHTWSLLLVGSAFRSLTAHQKLVTPSPSKGQSPPPVAVIEPAPTAAPVDISAKAQEMLKAGHGDKAINMVRDAIDANPFSVDLRVVLITLYEQTKDWSAAADTAKRGSEVLPESIALRKATLRDLLLAGRDKEAHDALNEILAREPNSVSTKLLESQTYLTVGDYAQATLSLDQAVKRFPSSDCYYWRALARAALGGADGVNGDVQEYLKNPFPVAEAADSCQECENILVKVTNRDIALSLAFFQQVGLHPDAQETKDQLVQLTNDAVARSNFLQQVPCAPGNKQSYGQLLLAQKLLISSFASIREVLKTGDTDSMTDARIELGDAIKAVKSSQKLLEREQGSIEVATPNMDKS